MIKKVIIIALVILSNLSFAQTKITPTEQFTITGKIKTELKFTLKDLSA
ncbi:MAG TPA: hypothetical protein VF411_14740 [Bacteroidia bacterium]